MKTAEHSVPSPWTQEDVARVARAIGAGEFGYRMELTRLVDGERTYTLWVPGEEPREFAETDELYAYVAQRKRMVSAGAVFEALQLPAAFLDVLAERRRHVEEGWTPEHDDEHDNNEMADAAAAYAYVSALSDRERAHAMAGSLQEGAPRTSIFQQTLAHLWPWDWSWWKPKDRRRDLVRAASLIIAEIERLDREAARAGKAA